VQARFVDDPKQAIADADELIVAVMKDRGYPMEDFDQRTADISVDHPDVVEHYREAHGVALAHAKGGSDTEALRNGMLHYRTLFTVLIAPDAEREAG
jgi:hypothetical protein